RWQ
ncbi:hypothetical protein D044_1875B, partial [Vibrio parahaemolyticus EKP-026]